jgi:hypothetical protein
MPVVRPVVPRLAQLLDRSCLAFFSLQISVTVCVEQQGQELQGGPERLYNLHFPAYP